MFYDWQVAMIFWGVWLLVPFIVDGISLLRDATLVWLNRDLARPYPLLPRRKLPKVSIVIPAFNEQVDIDRCITSLKAQTYPHHLIEVIVINDGSTDRTADVVNGHIDGNGHWNGHIRLHHRVIPAREFGGVLSLVEGGHHGKPAAVNLGLSRCRGDLVFTIDSDVVLEPEAIEQAVAAFQLDPQLMAASAHLIIDPYLVVQADEGGHISLDDRDLPIPRSLNFSERFLAWSQFLEYIESFRIGRHAEAVRGELFTISGACAMFRREALLGLNGYRGRTVSEDTDATLSLQRNAGKVAYLPQVRIHLAPTVSWQALYAQRLRWQRGELEVVAAHVDRLGHGDRFWRHSLPARMRKDHALALIRLLWVFLMPLFPLLGYTPAVLAQAMGLMVLMYLCGDLLALLVAWPISAASERRLLRRSLPYLLFLPFYRMVVYFFRLSGILKALSESPQWTVSGGARPARMLHWAQGLSRWMHRLVEVWAE